MSGQGKSNVAAVVLAAGSSRRFGGGSKLLAEVAGQPLIKHVAGALAASRASEVVVVTGPQPEAVEKALAGLPVRFVNNPDHLSGMGGSIAVGIAGLSRQCSGVLISPADMPGVTPELIDSLIAAFEAAGADRIVHPALPPDGRQGNPVLWPRRYFGRLAELRGPSGGKALLSAFPDDIDRLDWPDAGPAFDIDTQDDLARYRRAKHISHDS